MRPFHFWFNNLFASQRRMIHWGGVNFALEIKMRQKSQMAGINKFYFFKVKLGTNFVPVSSPPQPRQCPPPPEQERDWETKFAGNVRTWITRGEPAGEPCHRCPVGIPAVPTVDPQALSSFVILSQRAISFQRWGFSGLINFAVFSWSWVLPPLCVGVLWISELIDFGNKVFLWVPYSATRESELAGFKGAVSQNLLNFKQCELPTNWVKQNISSQNVKRRNK